MRRINGVTIKWRYYLDNIEIHLPAQWEQFIAKENHVELIRTNSMPLVSSLNGHSLVNYAPSAMAQAPASAAVPNSSIREQGNEQIELLKVCKETPQEQAISRPSGRRKRCFAVRRWPGCPPRRQPRS